METESYFNALRATKESIEAVRKAFEPELAFDFNTFDFFYPNENKTSEILAYFLNPKGKHGQGSLFFDIFFTNIKDYNDKTSTGRLDIVDMAKDKKVEIICEKSTIENRRIDIWVEIGNREYIIGIENKIYKNTKRPNQTIRRLQQELKQKSLDNFLLIYLSPQGKEIEETSISKENLKILSDKNQFLAVNYEEHIIEIVKKWHQQCRAVRVKSFLQDLEQFFKNQYTGEKFMESNEKLIEQALKPENAEITFDILFNEVKIFNRLMEILKKQIETACNLRRLELLEWKMNKYEKYSSFCITNEELKENNVYITFEFEQKNFRDLNFGFTYVQNKDETINATLLKEEFIKKYSGEYSNNGWYCWNSFIPTSWNENEFVMILKGELETKIMKVVEEMIEMYDEVNLNP